MRSREPRPALPRILSDELPRSAFAWKSYPAGSTSATEPLCSAGCSQPEDRSSKGDGALLDSLGKHVASPLKTVSSNSDFHVLQP